MYKADYCLKHFELVLLEVDLDPQLRITDLKVDFFNLVCSFNSYLRILPTPTTFFLFFSLLVFLGFHAIIGTLTYFLNGLFTCFLSWKKCTHCKENFINLGKPQKKFCF